MEMLKAKVLDLEKQLASFSTFLDQDQIKSLSVDKMHNWSSQSIVKALKLRFALGVHGYETMVGTGYPLPSYHTLQHRLRSYKVTDGVFTSLEEPIKKKVELMNHIDRFCAISIDGMQIVAKNDYDKHEKTFIGTIKLPVSAKSKRKKQSGSETNNSEELGNHILTVMVRGVASPWKQVIAMGITGDSTCEQATHQLIKNCVEFIEKCGLYVVSLTSDMGGSNRPYWTYSGVSVRRDGDRNNYITINDHKIYIVPDPSHLLKNLRGAMLAGTLQIPEFLKNLYNLPSTVIGGHHVRQLWNQQANEKYELRTLHHLTADDLYPDNFYKMHVGSAVRFFSVKTAAALELAVENKVLHEDALTTAWFIQKITKWFELVSSRVLKTSVTKNNRMWRYFIMDDIIEIFHHIVIGGQEWKPLNMGMILATLSLRDLCDFLFLNGFHYVMLSRFGQDALENVFSQLRRRCGKTPTALQCRRGMKLISISQFLTKVNRSSYLSDADVFLVDFFTAKGKENTDESANSWTTSAVLLPKDHIVGLPTHSFTTTTDFRKLDTKMLCNTAGIMTNAVLKQKVCNVCQDFLCSNPIEDSTLTSYIRKLNLGGLKFPNASVFVFVCNIELIYQQYKTFILHNCSKPLIEKIVADIDVEMPECCSIKKKIVDHFFTVRSFSVSNFNGAVKRKKRMYGTSTVKKPRK